MFTLKLLLTDFQAVWTIEPGEFGNESPDAFAELVAWLPSSDAPEKLMAPINAAALE